MINLILDIDGTLSDAKHRAHHVDKAKPDWDSFLLPELVIQDTVIQDSQKGVRHLTNITDNIFFLTGRNERLRGVTANWLKTHFGFDVNEKTLIMRPIDDQRVPTEFKHEELVKLVNFHKNDLDFKGKWMAVDDDPFMMKVYRGMGMVTLHAPEVWKHMFPDFDHLTNEQAWRK